MRPVLALVAAFAVLAGDDLGVAQVGQFPFALTREGQMLGGVEGDISSFKGLAYAMAPIGPLRWRPPQDAPESSEMRTAYDYGPACLQPGIAQASEHCLTLNVFRPFGVDGPLPIMVFIHGGDFVGGTANDPLFDGARLAQAGLIAITLNYRLGAFGWLVHSALAEGSSGGAVMNYGLMDQIAALQWIHDNAAAFGGDPDNITLFGSGAGATSIALLMLCDQSRDLFQKAILQSLPGRGRLRSIEAAQTVGKEFAEIAARDQKEFDLRTADPKRLMAAQKLLLARYPRAFGPVVDGVLVKSDIAAGFAAGRENRIPLIIGSNDDETGSDNEPDAKEEFGLAGASADELRQLYPESSSGPAELAARLYTDRMFTEPARLLARLHAARGASTFRYRFGYVPEAERAGREGGQGRELQFIFGVEGVPGAGVLSRRDREVGRVLRSYWINFARTGDPNGADLPRWDAGTDRDQLLLITNERISGTADPWSERLDRLERRSLKE
ncbi:carboxylesterase/lipase family protein [Bradyrhizobium liaoningense]|uniref:carboxylesterase/lipase family protein n=1 Tax=Bradyrhizobium liaoningense TaxID=43992 RepID=UPI001BA65081|nr:carboxylesterase family protein [Bradyrhizobium liaoningense]MBR0717071.1 carboxylesterase family protein [Bradyrhizobium liaoningense]